MTLGKDLAAAVEAAETGLRRCTVCSALATMGREDQVSLRVALNSKLGSKRLSIILQKNGVAVGVPSIRSHRLEGHQ